MKTAEEIAQDFIDSSGSEEFHKAEDGKYWYKSADGVNGIDLKYYFALLIDYIQEDLSFNAQQSKGAEQKWGDAEILEQLPNLNKSANPCYEGAKWMRSILLPIIEAQEKRIAELERDLFKYDRFYASKRVKG
jgi:hypothetical protein